jgi:ParB family chromosome partitioning protein
MKLKSITIGELFPDPDQPRREFDETHHQNLVASLRTDGQMLPIIVFPIATGYQIVEGACRWRAALEAGLSELAAVVLDAAPSPAALLKLQLKVNCLRQQLTPLERGLAYQRVIEQEQCSQRALAQMVHVSDATVTACLSILKLPPEIQSRVNAGEVPLSSAYTIARAPDRATQFELAEQAATGALTRDALQRRLRKKAGGMKAKRVSCALKDHTVTICGQHKMDLDTLLAVLEGLVRDARRARVEGLDVLTWSRVLRDRAKAAMATSGTAT